MKAADVTALRKEQWLMENDHSTRDYYEMLGVSRMRRRTRLPVSLLIEERRS